ncbi:hypothetical protein [Mycobacterium nebraskense]|uniref:hypothetical protein n=1 Tax=Mycobacterium nebraskense TaxID=244292 RepID=UPI0039C8D103
MSTPFRLLDPGASVGHRRQHVVDVGLQRVGDVDVEAGRPDRGAAVVEHPVTRDDDAVRAPAGVDDAVQAAERLSLIPYGSAQTVRVGLPDGRALRPRTTRARRRSRPFLQPVTLLPHFKMRAKADSLPHVNVRACLLVVWRRVRLCWW